MAIEVIGREVQQHRDPRPERVGGLELEAARLDDVDVSAVDARPARSRRDADVAADRGLDRRLRASGPISVVVVDLPLVPVTRRCGLEPARRELQLADHRHAGGACGGDRRPASATRRGSARSGRADAASRRDARRARGGRRPARSSSATSIASRVSVRRRWHRARPGGAPRRHRSAPRRRPRRAARRR